MPTNKTIGMLLGGIVIITFIFWMAGAVESFWTGLSIAALLLLFFATSLLTAYKKTAISILILTLAFLFIRHIMPEVVEEAVTTRAVDTAVRTSVTVGNPAARIEKARVATCKKDMNAALDRNITPRKRELDDMNSGLHPFDAARHDILIAEIKDWERKIKKAAHDCMEGLRYAIPSLPDIPEPRLPSSRSGATLLFAALLLSGWGIYRSTKDSRWTRWIGGPLLILSALYLVYLFFNAGMDKKIEEGVERWQISTKESPAPPPPPPPPAPPKKEKIIAAKEKRWQEATDWEARLRSTYPFGNGSALLQNKGDLVDIPKMGEGSCSAIWVENGVAHIGALGMPSLPVASHPEPAATNCNNQVVRVVAKTDNTRISWRACRAKNKRCLIYDQ